MSFNLANNIDVAFGKFDRYIEIVSGKDTLHKAVGIAYETLFSATEEGADYQAEDNQQVKVNMHVDKKSSVVTSDGSQNKKRRRNFVGTGLDIEPYKKKPKILFSGRYQELMWYKKKYQLKFKATKEKRLTPNGMSFNLGSNIGVAFGKFDRYVEIVSGKDTLHNVVGIAYETSSIATEESVDYQAEDNQ